MNSNREYFNSEAAKNRDVWKYADASSERILKLSNIRTNPYAKAKFDDVLRAEKFSASGEEETENEESVEYENELPEEEFEPDELPKFRYLVRAKKLEYKAQYGKAHIGTRRECKNVPYPSTCYKVVLGVNTPYPCMKNKQVCINIPTWVWGWRKKWREFKQAGGLAQLKMQSKGMAPIPGYVPPVETGNNTNTGSGPGKGRTLGEESNVELNLPGTQTASVGKNILGTILILGLVFGAIKFMK